MNCQYCNKRLGIIQRLKGQSFCSAEHQELHFGLSFERLRASVAEFTPDKPEPDQSRAKPEPAAAGVDQSVANGEPAKAKLEQPQANPAPAPPPAQQERPQAELVAELQLHAAKAPQEASPALEIVSLVEAVGTATGVDLPEAPFLPELPSRQDQAAYSLKSYTAEPVFATVGTVQLPVNTTHKPLLRASPSLVLDVSPAQPRIEIAPVASQAAWRPVPQGYPPVIVSASATLLLDSNEAKLIALPMGEPRRGKGPIPPPQSSAMETPLRQPLLPSRQADLRPAEVCVLSARPPQAPACDPLWNGSQGSGPGLPQLAGILRPQRDVVRLVPPVTPANSGELPSFPFFVQAPAVPVPSAQIIVAPASYFEPTITPRSTIGSETPLTSRGLMLPEAGSPLALYSTTPLPSEPSLSEVHYEWLLIAVASQTPRAATVLPPGFTGLSAAAVPIPLACSSATNYPAGVPTAPAVTGTIPYLLSTGPTSLAAPAMPAWSGTRPLALEPRRLPSPVSEQEYIQSAAYLHPSLPSPLSLVTWSQSLAVSIPARNPSNLGRPAPLGVSANPGRTQALRPWSPSRREYRPTPLLPQPSRVVWAPAEPMQATLRPPVIKPIRPGSQGTAPPCLATVRPQPASMPVLPVVSAPLEIDLEAGNAPFCASSFEDTLKVVGIDMAQGAPATDPALPAESSTVLPSFSASQPVPAIALAPGSSHRVWWSAMPPVQTVGTVEPFSALRRLAWSLTASLPGAPPPQLGLDA